MHPLAHLRRRMTAGGTPLQTMGRILDRGWRYDLMVWLADTLVLRGKLRLPRVPHLHGSRVGFVRARKAG